MRLQHRFSYTAYFGRLHCFQTLHHFSDPGPVIREVERVLRHEGHFYFDEEPMKRWLCLNMYRCDRPESLTGWNRRLFQWGLLRYIAEAYIGSAPEVDYGCVENQNISLRRWERFLSVFGAYETDRQLVTYDGQLFGRFLRKLGFRPETANRVAANLFGATISGLAVAEKPECPHESDKPWELLRCPDCFGLLDMLQVPIVHFRCPSCGPFEVFNGVHMLLSRKQLDALYPTTPEGGPEQSEEHQFEWLSQAESLRVRHLLGRHKEGKSPHPLTKRAVIRKVSLLNASNKSVTTVETGEPTTIRVEIEVRDEISDPVVGFIIRSILNGRETKVYDTNTMWRRQPTGDFFPGQTIVVEYRQDMSLGPGSYYLSTAIASRGAESFYDWRESVLAFEVRGSEGMQGLTNLNSEILVLRD